MKDAKSYTPHNTCDAHLTAWELVLPRSSSQSISRNDSAISRFGRSIRNNPRYTIAAAFGGLLASAALENIAHSSDEEVEDDEEDFS